MKAVKGPYPMKRAICSFWIAENHLWRIPSQFHRDFL